MTNNNFVKDKTNKEFLEKDVFDNVDKTLSEETEKAINDKVEKSFQDFLRDKKDALSNVSDDVKQSWFNDWLEWNVDRILDKEKIKEIQKVNSNIEPNLKSLEFEIELSNLEQNINQTRNVNTVQLSDSIKIEGIITNQVTEEKLKSLINKINTTNFTDREYLIECLNSWKIEDVRKIQYLVIWKKDSYEKWQTLKEKSLSVYWTDAKFGNETYEAINLYIDEHEINSTPATTASVGGQNTNAESSVTGSNSSTSVSGSIDKAPQTTTSSSKVTAVETNTYSVDTWVEIGDENMALQCKIGETIDITQIPSECKIKIIPHQHNKDSLIFSGEKLQYKWNFPGQDNFTVIITDKDWNEVFNKNITVNIDDEEWSVKINDYQSVFTKVEKELKRLDDELKSKSFQEQKRHIEANFSELKAEYKKNLNEITKNKLNDEEKQELSDRNNEIEAITKAFVLREAEMHMKEYLNNDKDKLNDKLNEYCDYYFDGKYISKKEFMRDLKKWKINLNEIRFVSFDVVLDNFNREGETEIHKYLESGDKGNRNFTIKDLILTNDKNLGREDILTKNQEIQYKAERYFWSEKTKNIQREKRALKRILWIKGLFGWGWVDEDMSISTLDYNTNNPALLERRNLRRLKKILWDAYKNEDVSVKGLFHDVSRDYDLSIPPRPSQNQDKNRQEFFELYRMYKEDKNCGDYFKKSMWLLENYFLRWIDGFDIATDDDSKIDASDLFTSIYKKEAIWRADGLIDPDKRRLAVNHLFKKSTRKWTIEFTDVDFTSSKELRELKRMVNKIDLSTYLTDPNASKKHEKFTKLYDKYKKSKQGDVKDVNGNFVVMWEKDTSDPKKCYYNAVFDFLAWVVEWRQDIVSAVNNTKILKELDDIDIEGNEKELFDDRNEKAFLMLISDFNQDWRVDHGDRWYVMWLTVKNVYKSVKIDFKHLGQDSESETKPKPWKNLISYCKLLMEENSDLALLNDIEKLNDENNLETVLDKLKTNPGLLWYFQTTLANSPMPIDYIFRYGEGASEEYLNFVLPQIENGTFKIEWLDEAFRKEYQKLIDQWLKDDPEIRAVLKPMFYAGVVNNGWISGSLWTWLIYDAGKAGQFSMNLWVWNLAKDEDPVLGVVFSYNKSIKLSDNTSFDLGGWVWTRGWLGSEDKLMFLPMAYGNAWITSRLNPGVNLTSLKNKSAHYFSVWWNVTWISGAWFGGGWYLWRSRDKMKLVDEQSLQIKETLTGRNSVLYNVLNSADLSRDKDNVVYDIRQGLTKHFFKKSFDKLGDQDKKLVSKAAENLYRWISYYSAWIKFEKDDKRATAIIHDVAEAYAIQRKNDAKIDAKDLHLSGAWISVQMLANFVPIVSFVEFSKYKNLYSKETAQSKANHFEKLVKWIWMNMAEWKDFYKEWYMTQSAVNYLNDKLSIAHPDISTPDLNIKLKPITDSVDGKMVQVLYIPLDLIKYANINIDSDVANYTTIDSEGKHLLVPSNTKIWLIDYSRLGSARFHLIIWDDKVKVNDVKVWYDIEDYGWDPTKYEWGIDTRVIMEREKINEKINALNQDIDPSKYEDELLPIDECLELRKWEAVLKLKDGFDNRCKVVWTTDLVKIDGDILTMPQTGTLFIVKKTDGEYNFYYKSHPLRDLVLDYRIDKYTQKTHTKTVTETNESGQTVVYERREIGYDVDMFLEYSEIDKLFDNIEKELSRMDNNVPSVYGQFMANSFTYATTVIEEDNYNEAFVKLTEILNDNTNNFNDNMFDNLRNKIDGSLTPQEKVMIVDRFKAVFSYHPTLSEGFTNNWAWLEKVFNSRKDFYRQLYWYDKTAKFPLDDSYRKDLLNDFKKQWLLERRKEKNLFGMTAFYRSDNRAWRWYSMTQMWYTNVLAIKGDSESWIKKIAWTDLPSAQDWFWKNLNKSGPHKEILVKMLEKQINISGLKLTDDHLKILLKWETIDIGGNIIKLDLDYVFYLLWECANESIWIKLNGIKIKKEKDYPQVTSTETIDEREDEISKEWHRTRIVEWQSHYDSNIKTRTDIANAEKDFAKKKKVSFAGSYSGRLRWEPKDDPHTIISEDSEEPADNPQSQVDSDINDVNVDNPQWEPETGSNTGAGDDWDGLSHWGDDDVKI